MSLMMVCNFSVGENPKRSLKAHVWRVCSCDWTDFTEIHAPQPLIGKANADGHKNAPRDRPQRPGLTTGDYCFIKGNISLRKQSVHCENQMEKENCRKWKCLIRKIKIVSLMQQIQGRWPSQMSWLRSSVLR